MTRFLLSFLFIFSFSSFLLGQGKAHLITLNPTETLNAPSFYITKVIDQRANKESIGVVQKGMGNRQVRANFPADFSAHLLSTFNKILIPNKDRQGLQVIIHQLYISERTSAWSELATCELKLEFAKEVDGSLSSLGVFQNTVSGKGAEVTKKHGRHIVEGLVKSILQLKGTDWKNKEATPITAVESNPSSDTPSKVLDLNLIPKKGLYTSYNALLKNEPDLAIPYEVKLLKQTKKIEHFQVYHKGTKKRIKGLFGFSDGINFCLSASQFAIAEHFVKPKMIGRYIYFEDTFVPKSAVAASAGFGLLGAAASKRQYGVALDSHTGITVVLTNGNMYKLLKPHPKLLQAYKKATKSMKATRYCMERVNQAEAEQ